MRSSAAACFNLEIHASAGDFRDSFCPTSDQRPAAYMPSARTRRCCLHPASLPSANDFHRYRRQYSIAQVGNLRLAAQLKCPSEARPPASSPQAPRSGCCSTAKPAPNTTTAVPVCARRAMTSGLTSGSPPPRSCAPETSIPLPCSSERVASPPRQRAGPSGYSRLPTLDGCSSRTATDDAPRGSCQVCHRLCSELDERAYLRRQYPLGGIDRVDWRRAASVSAQDTLDFPSIDGASRIEQGCGRNA